MIGIFLTVAEKVLILFVMIGVGVVLCKRRMPVSYTHLLS